MSVYMHFDDDKAGDQIASSGGWSDVIRWAENLPQEPYADLIGALNDGESSALAKVEEQLREAIEFYPAQADVTLTLNGFLECLESRNDTAKKIHFGNGMSADDGE